MSEVSEVTLILNAANRTADRPAVVAAHIGTATAEVQAVRARASDTYGTRPVVAVETIIEDRTIGGLAEACYGKL